MNQTLFYRQALTANILDSENKILRQALLLVIGVVALIVSSKMAIPLNPVPITLQNFVVLSIGMIYGWRLGSLTVATFLLLGLIGFPVFAWPIGGPAVFFGITGGYLMGFLPAAFVSGLLIEYGWGKSQLTTFLAGLIGVAVIYFYGIFWLTKTISLSAAIAIGFTPFILVDMLKIFVLALVIPKFWK